MTKYQLQPAAEQDLEAIWLYSVNRWGVPQADAYIDDLDECFHLLANEPLLASVRKEFNPPVRIHSHRQHLVVHTLSEPGVVIVRVLHQSMEIGQQLAIPEDHQA